MNRTLRLKTLYVALLAGLGLLTWGVLVWLFPGRLWLGALVLVPPLLVPGRIQGAYFRRLFTARRLLDAGRPAEALEPLRAFIGELQAHPARNRLLWLGFSVYTTSAEAMGWNNLGAAHTQLGEWSAAQDAFERALALDDAYPLPHVNLARLALVRGERDTATRHLATASRLGYDGTKLDQLLHEAQSLLARVEGHAAPRPS